MVVNNIITDSVFSATKAYSLKGTILDKNTLESLTESNNLDDLIIRLKATKYEKFVSSITQPYTSQNIELNVKQHLVDIHKSLIQSSPNHKIVDAYYEKYLVSNLKKILKAKALKKTYEETTTYIDLHAEEIIGRRDLITRMLSAETFDEISTITSGHKFEKEINLGIKTYNEHNKLEIFDLFLDNIFFSHLAKTSSSYKNLNANTRKLVAIDVDSFKITSILRAKYWNMSYALINEFLIKEKFDISHTKINKMINADNIQNAIEHVVSTPYSGILKIESQNEIELISKIEEYFKITTNSIINKNFTWNAFDENCALSLIKLKEIEIQNIAKIAFGVENKIEQKTIYSNLKI